MLRARLLNQARIADRVSLLLVLAYAILGVTGIIARNWYIIGVSTPVLVVGICIGKLADRWRERANVLAKTKIGQELSRMSYDLQGPHGG